VERGTGQRPVAFYRSRARDRGEKREAGGVGGRQWEGGQMMHGEHEKGAPVLTGGDNVGGAATAGSVPAAARAGGLLCFEQEWAAPGR
jgi:hypothetical protein